MGKQSRSKGSSSRSGAKPKTSKTSLLNHTKNSANRDRLYKLIVDRGLDAALKSLADEGVSNSREGVRNHLLTDPHKTGNTPYFGYDLTSPSGRSRKYLFPNDPAVLADQPVSLFEFTAIDAQRDQLYLVIVDEGITAGLKSLALQGVNCNREALWAHLRQDPHKPGNTPQYRRDPTTISSRGKRYLFPDQDPTITAGESEYDTFPNEESQVSRGVVAGPPQTNRIPTPELLYLEDPSNLKARRSYTYSVIRKDSSIQSDAEPESHQSTFEPTFQAVQLNGDTMPYSDAPTTSDPYVGSMQDPVINQQMYDVSTYGRPGVIANHRAECPCALGYSYENCNCGYS